MHELLKRVQNHSIVSHTGQACTCVKAGAAPGCLARGGKMPR